MALQLKLPRGLSNLFTILSRNGLFVHFILLSNMRHNIHNCNKCLPRQHCHENKYIKKIQTTRPCNLYVSVSSLLPSIVDCITKAYPGFSPSPGWKLTWNIVQKSNMFNLRCQKVCQYDPSYKWPSKPSRGSNFLVFYKVSRPYWTLGGLLMG